jgi:LPPG:FO 2-phospho-L-lactate transferase
VITVLAGGVGAARFLRGVVRVVDPREVTAVINTADDVVLHGLAISPDIDTVTYTLAGAIDPDRGWGLRDETWRTMEALARFVAVRPSGSAAAPTWFNLGDQDLATHFYRTARLAEGARLTEVTAEIASAFGLDVSLLPMTDDRVETRVTVADEGEINFQEYFVRRHHDVAVESIRFAGSDSAVPTAEVLDALGAASGIVIAPSNPIVSIGPIRSLAGIDAILRERREHVSAISPIVGGAALKGPADRMLTELGHDPSVVGVARLYAPIASTLVIDPVDAHLSAEVDAAGIRPLVAPSVMSTLEIAADLARVALGAVGVGV